MNSNNEDKKEQVASSSVKPTAVQRLRRYRVYHKIIGLCLAIVLLISAITGFLLGWKKDVGLLQPPTQKGASQELHDWLPIDQLARIAQDSLYQFLPDQAGNPIDRMDVRPSKGIVKVLFEKKWWEVQVDGTTGEVLSIAQRHSDWIEKIHDGSIISDLFKLISMNILGIGLALMIITGLWLWYGPKRIRKLKKNAYNS